MSKIVLLFHVCHCWPFTVDKLAVFFTSTSAVFLSEMFFFAKGKERKGKENIL